MKKLLKRLALALLIGAPIGVLIGLLTSCAMPGTTTLDISAGGLKTSRLYYVFPGTGFVLWYTDVVVDFAMSGWELAGTIAGIVLGGNTAITAMLPKGWDNLATIFDSDAEWPDTWRSAAAMVIPGWHSSDDALARKDRRTERRAAKKVAEAEGTETPKKVNGFGKETHGQA